jgi:hypothetical protein
MRELMFSEAFFAPAERGAKVTVDEAWDVRTAGHVREHEIVRCRVRSRSAVPSSR